MDANHRTIFHEFKKTSEAYPDKPCIKFKDAGSYKSVTYSQLYEKILQFRNLLVEARLSPGERVAILSSNSPNWPLAFFSIVSMQAVAVPIDIQLSPQLIKEMLTHSQCRLILTEEKFGIALGEVLPVNILGNIIFLDRHEWSQKCEGAEPEPNIALFSESKLAALFYTSGTTKEHKAVMLTHKNLLSNVSSLQKINILTKDDTIMSLLPLHHTYPFMVTCLAPLLFGGTVCYLQSVVQRELFECLKENKVTIFVGVPQLFSIIERSISNQLAKYGAIFKWAMSKAMDLCWGLSVLSGRNVSKLVSGKLHAALGGHIKVMASGGAKLDPEVAKSFSRWGFKIIEGYGLTETSPIVTFNPLNAVRFGSAGKSLPGVKVRIVDADSAGLGEVAVKGANVMLGYYRLPSLTKSVLRDGWFFTGDEGFLDKEGYLYITGRRDELIVLASGKKINPEKVEAHYLKSPFIKEMCIVYVKASEGGGHLSAVIVPEEDYLKEKKFVNINFKIRWELDGYSHKLLPYQRVKGFVLAKGPLPRTRLGKLMRYKISEEFAAGAFSAAEKKQDVDSGELSGFEETAVKYISKILKKDVNINDHLELDLGLDSLGRIELLSALQDVISAGIDDALAIELFEARTVRELISRAKEALPESAFSGLLKREDAVFWSQVLAQPPSEADKSRLKLHFDFFDKCISILEILIFKLLFRTIFLLRVKGRKNIPKEAPFIITPNHCNYLDAFFVLCAMPTRLLLQTYFVGFGSVFSHPLLSWAVRFHRMVPIDADLNLARSLKVCGYLIKQGKVLVYFPEGQRSGDGQIKEFRKGIGILVKEAGAGVLPVYISGSFKVWPRSRAFPLPAPVTIKVGKYLDVSGVAYSSKEDPYVLIANKVREEVALLKEGRAGAF